MAAAAAAGDGWVVACEVGGRELVTAAAAKAKHKKRVRVRWFACWQRGNQLLPKSQSIVVAQTKNTSGTTRAAT